MVWGGWLDLLFFNFYNKFIKKLWDEHIGYNDALQIINGTGDVGRILVESNDVDIICFTGSTNVGKMIAKKCAEPLKPVVLELGGKDPMIVLKDANIHRASESAAFGGLSNAGQTCISTEEVFVEDPVFDEFVSGISDKVKNMSSGDSDSEDLGPMIVDENRDKVNEHIREVDGRCNIVNGGVSDTNRFIAPTLLIDPPDDSRVVNEETFGPVISIRPFNNTDDLMDKIIVCGSYINIDIYRNAKRVGVRGIVCGGIDYSTISEILGYSIGVAITGYKANKASEAPLSMAGEPGRKRAFCKPTNRSA